MLNQNRGFKMLYMGFLALLVFSPILEAETWTATAYCACKRCCGKSDGITASGRKATENRTVAVNWLRFGTRLLIDGKTYVVEDRGAVSHFGSKKKPKKRVDIYFLSHAEALRFGRRNVEVKVI